jgi:hypothetical protein
MTRFGLLLLMVIPIANAASQTSSTSSPSPLRTPSEAYAYAMNPYVEARQSPDDLTEADQWALRLSVQRAREQCVAMMPYDKQDEQLLSLGQLCVLGEKFFQAKQSLENYLLLPQPANAEDARILLIRAEMALKTIHEVDAQARILSATTPYDSKVHATLKFAVDAVESKDATADDAVSLVEVDLPGLWNALSGPGNLTAADKSMSFDADQLMMDAVGYARVYRDANATGKASALIGKIEALLQTERYANLAALPGTRQAIKRYALFNTKVTAASLQAQGVTMGGILSPNTVPLRGRTTVLIPFSFASPQSGPAIGRIIEAIRNVANVKVYAVTSFHANTGGDDNPSKMVVHALGQFKQALPPEVKMAVLPAGTLASFAIDTYPSVIVINGQGNVRMLEPFSGGPGSLRRLLLAVR